MHLSSSLFRNDGEGRFSLAFIFAALTLAAAVLLGGASRNNAGLVAAIEVLCLPALLWAVWRAAQTPAFFRIHRLPLLVLAGLVAVPLLQLIPLPPAVWAKLPGHEAAATALSLAGIPAGWRPVSLTPAATAAHLLALAPPVALFLATLQATGRERMILTSLVVVAGLVSIGLGALQVASGVNSALYFYDPTNPGSAVGLFSNRNHQAALLICALPFAALWIETGRRNERYKVPLILAAACVFLIAIVGLVIVKSRAGVLLLAPAIVASFLIVWREGRGGNKRIVALLGGATIVVLFLAAAFGMAPLMDRFGDGLVDGRGATRSTVLAAAAGHLPLGSGVGSFVPVFTAVEPVDTMGPAVWNHAHNDYAELWLEGGVLAAVVMAGFAAWWVLASIRVWRGFGSVASSGLAQAGFTCTAVLLLHSTVDYPLRTLALACVFGLACALMEKARTSDVI